MPESFLPKTTIYVLYRVDWEYNDSYYDPRQTNEVVSMHRTEESAEKARLAELRRFAAEWDDAEWRGAGLSECFDGSIDYQMRTEEEKFHALVRKVGGTAVKRESYGGTEYWDTTIPRPFPAKHVPDLFDLCDIEPCYVREEEIDEDVVEMIEHNLQEQVRTFYPQKGWEY